jgi:hypothetical protein
MNYQLEVMAWWTLHVKNFLYRSCVRVFVGNIQVSINLTWDIWNGALCLNLTGYDRSFFSVQGETLHVVLSEKFPEGTLKQY